MTDKKTTEIKIPQPRMIMLTNGQQVIAGVYTSEGSDFIRLHEPYKVRIHENAVDSETYYVEERMSLTPWMFQTIDKTYSIHKTNIFSIGVPNKNLTEYYNNVRLGLFPTLKKEIEPLMTKQQHDNSFEKAMEEMSDEDYFQTLEYLRGKIKAN
tara:strand:+ start:188 stop:649 length:462 start_codon:yes stop_codon:yes gene_type:complete